MEAQLTPLQQNVLDKYSTLATSLHSLDAAIQELNANQRNKDKTNASPEEVLAEMRELEVKLALVGTLLKGSVYSYVLSNQGQKV
ncbi:similar to Saccharomyces cerevisiae YBR233W-A DAD3 Essential subunit of the Dam1 complex (aka DASH complex) [Maudiozyma barnettii]|uniref:DASH complex subunit DAD3 n=1 Tax=Maudiozyma barnettii TaxID=61262 RepID=A0A8H2ZK57_9SACH|nr:Dad3p [Kazachstania barnettii]CAB4257222.1 similar to Saccharomyces cerevisiae YBR233W-A DAD3 Essential subunit of the Dam1 complex (aka DASH complex) [Kazachstania barnettii]CAD1779592.1 similar to Saccharomyces cerevisiae YBR233W-A DAD3 Essential subunit of the Dam1 complex (aka DASH complex) [Kazachstania barnettii]